jgi:hypothetical protein
MYNIACIEPMLKKIGVSDISEVEDCEQLVGAETRYFSLLSVEAGLVPVQPTAYSVPSPAVKRPEHKDDHAPPSTAEIKNEWSYFFVPSYAFIAFTGTHLRVLPLPNSRG